MNKLTKTFSIIATAVAVLTSAGCSDSTQKPAGESSVSAESSVVPSIGDTKAIHTKIISIEAIRQGTRGFSVGNGAAARVAYVFFDPQCPHCGELWFQSQPLLKQNRFVWVPVGLLNRASTTQSIALLAAQNPAQAMAEHEASLLGRRGGISASASNPPELESAVKANTEMLRKLGATGVPFVVTAAQEEGKVRVMPYAADTATFAAFLGSTASASSAPSAAQ